MDRQDGLQIQSDERHQRHEWCLEVTGWVAIALVLAAALAGLTGAGPLSRTGVEEDGARLEYNRFVRRQAPERLVVLLAPGMAAGGQARVWFDRSFIEDVEVQQVLPDPLVVEAEGDRYVWVFAVPKGAGEPLQVTFRYQPDFIGRRVARLGVDGGPRLAVWQFALP